MPPRPLSPHLSVYKFKYTLTTSILNRFAGLALSLGLPLLVYWLLAVAGGAQAQARAMRVLSLPLMRPLLVWFVVSLLSLPSHDHATVVAWMGQSWTALLLVLLVLVGAWHSQLGLRVVVEDYVHGAPARTVTLVLLMFAHVLLAGAGVVAVLRVALGAAP